VSSFPFLDHPGPIPFAHRGGASEAPENSLPAFQHAIDLGFRYLETDVHATADGVLVAFHDDVLDRVTDRTGRIEDLPWSEVSQARIEGREPIPLLEDVLATWPHARLNIDPKADSAVEPLIEVLRRTDAISRVCVASFSDERTDRVRAALGPELCTGMARRSSWNCSARSKARRSSSGRRPRRSLPSTTGDARSPPASWSRWPTPTAWSCTCGPSTMPMRCDRCSTAASTGS
jgi:glycerophosphoryl diester phosphodiesterase